MQSAYTIPDVHAYEARNNYWVGEILKGISGASLYQTTHTELPWGINIKCDDLGRPRTVEFQNGVEWSFCAPKVYHFKTEWPLFVQDLQRGDGKIFARVERIFSDSMNLSLTSENACLSDMLIWHYPPRKLSDEFAG